MKKLDPEVDASPSSLSSSEKVPSEVDELQRYARHIYKALLMKGQISCSGFNGGLYRKSSVSST